MTPQADVRLPYNSESNDGIGYAGAPCAAPNKGTSFKGKRTTTTCGTLACSLPGAACAIAATSEAVATSATETSRYAMLKDPAWASRNGLCDEALSRLSVQ